jgi:hypothetical protein
MLYNILRDWSIHEEADGSYVIEGDLYNDAKERWHDGVRVTTSRLRSVDFVANRASTEHTEYNLGMRRNVSGVDRPLSDEACRAILGALKGVDIDIFGEGNCDG